MDHNTPYNLRDHYQPCHTTFCNRRRRCDIRVATRWWPGALKIAYCVTEELCVRSGLSMVSCVMCDLYLHAERLHHILYKTFVTIVVVRTYS